MPSIHLRTLPLAAASTVALTSVTTGAVVGAQEPLPLISVEADLEAYGMNRAEEVRRGRLSSRSSSTVMSLVDEEALAELRSRVAGARLVRRLLGSPAFAGLAFHDYRGLRRLLSGG